jgi:hypothetical protein
MEHAEGMQKQAIVHVCRCHMNKSVISSIATEVHELDVQHLIDVWMKTLPLDNSDAVPSEVTTRTVYGF